MINYNMKNNPLKYFNDQDDKRRASFPKAALGNLGEPLTPNKSEYWQVGDSSNIKSANINRLAVRLKAENNAGYFNTGTGYELDKAKANRDLYAKNKEAYMKEKNVSPEQMAETSKPIPVPELKPYVKKRKSHFR
jgi:hypothetical protein